MRALPLLRIKTFDVIHFPTREHGESSFFLALEALILKIELTRFPSRKSAFLSVGVFSLIFIILLWLFFRTTFYVPYDEDYGSD